MQAMLEGVTLVVLGLCAATMGFAIQRGATCTVAAVEEVVARRGATRLIALVEASLWVAGGLLVARQLGWVSRLPGGHATSLWTVGGAALLGFGAFTAGACVFGAIARLGSGDWAYAATPVGFYLGCVSVERVFAPPLSRGLDAGPLLAAAPMLMAGIVGACAVWRVAAAAVRHGRTAPSPIHGIWSPHVATIVIGLAFLVMLVLAGAWAYTDVLADLARGMAHAVGPRVVLLACLLIGAIAGGWSAGRLRRTRIRPAAVVRCTVGGLLMGWGSLLIPGGNDGLVLVGMPLLWPYAWVAFATMCGTIALAQAARDRLLRADAGGIVRA